MRKRPRPSPPSSTDQPPLTPAVTADVVLLRPDARRLSFLAVQRRFPPFEGCWALPGGFVEPFEDLTDAAARELAEETALSALALWQLGAYGNPQRDPRRSTVTVAHVGFARPGAVAQAGDDAAEACWHDALRPPELAFDHTTILADALTQLRRRLDRDEPPVGYLEAWDPKPTPAQLCRLHGELGAGPRTAGQLRRWARKGLLG